MLKLRFPIRLKIVALIVTALTASLLSYIFVGTSLIIEDKTSYIYDYNVTEVRAASDIIGGQIERVQSMVRALGSLVRAGNPNSATLVRDFYNEHEQRLALDGLILARAPDGQQFRIESNLSKDPKRMESALAQLGWTPAHYEKNEILTGPSIADKIPVGLRIKDSEGKPLAAVALLGISGDVFQSRGKFRLHVIDAGAKHLVGSVQFFEGLNPEKVQSFEKTLLDSGFSSGARDWSSGSDDFIVAYQRLSSVPLTVVGMISKKESFLAAERLVQRSTILGLSILFLALAFTWIFAKSLTQRLRRTWDATQKVTEGDFSVRVDVGGGNDEVTGLALSFNKMADRINELMAQTAEKARMEKELETAQAVQKRFFPVTSFSHGNISISGKALPASECAGDWWQYAEQGKYLIVAVGDVTGHGVSSALVTAAAYGAFSISIRSFTGLESISGLVKNLDWAVRAAGGGQTNMTMLISVIHIETGMMHVVNAGHRLPYVFRKGGRNDGHKSFVVLSGGEMPPLGDNVEITPEPALFQLQAGDVIFWYTDGLVECVNPAGSCMNKTELRAHMAQLAASELSDSAEKVCTDLFQNFVQFLGVNAKNPDDDTTLVVGVVPSTARLTPPQS
ncbi:MAG: hypothetical protein A2428_07535 [Bdellovibrionales bacterium RIFOXYC1_FULL_54_43]|nr:MAG: hypothetical protein A2428_07535 [Bdellovibrionales bacterium RIFOXYC1_FULL_54_43]OFZ84041.1 MAG: hypothetical protein A2603_15775 [Bdellovibrionales bacterium RIFOXYD1_FULL_55_31]